MNYKALYLILRSGALYLALALALAFTLIAFITEYKTLSISKTGIIPPMIIFILMVLENPKANPDVSKIISSPEINKVFFN
ncbi:hypothetical protein CMU68_07765 [Elizabethkingia anophelis]|nr:hypothetical protein [Elizabethkingia anophelis]MDV3679967.1 hypothetical protein [Elizabethkingia anophelis]MDV3711920.1 hypothetical protein [Elizabethkingia anophelis]MDV3766199.1 hypothetical protein [Elizabethkingia anophelis]MDV3787837.1 hypothetical protein [Elizabethkingia anophelis]